MFESPMHFYIHHFGTDQDLELITRSALDTQAAIAALESGAIDRARQLWDGVNGESLLKTWDNQNDRKKERGPKWKPLTDSPIGSKTAQVTQSLARRIYERDDYRCRYCGLPVFTRWKGSPILRLVEAFKVESGSMKIVNGSLHGSGKNGALRNCDYAKFLWSLAACDHVFPRSLGGATDESNLVTSCSGCNYSKGNLTLVQMSVKSPLNP
jgi:hypothetical protein